MRIPSFNPKSILARRAFIRAKTTSFSRVEFRSLLSPDRVPHSRFEEMKLTLLRVKDYLGVEMVKQRYLNIGILGRLSSGSMTSSEGVRNISYTLSNLAGHGSFLLLALSYLENDFMQLRLFAASGMVLSMIFQYYRAIPLWIPIRWNFLFLLINATMIGLLLKEEADADNMSRDEMSLYSAVFEKRGIDMIYGLL